MIMDNLEARRPLKNKPASFSGRHGGAYKPDLVLDAYEEL
jgi:hypothetical protein